MPRVVEGVEVVLEERDPQVYSSNPRASAWDCASRTSPKFLVPVTISLTAGLLFGMAATLVLVPACYAVVEDLRSRVTGPKLATTP